MILFPSFAGMRVQSKNTALIITEYSVVMHHFPTVPMKKASQNIW